jgi:hypothetical protein
MEDDGHYLTGFTGAALAAQSPGFVSAAKKRGFWRLRLRKAALGRAERGFFAASDCSLARPWPRGARVLSRQQKAWFLLAASGGPAYAGGK